MATEPRKPAAQTGPKSARGKANSSRNAQKHGLLSRHLIIAGEDRGEFDTLLATLQTELRPVGLLEHVLAERIAVTLWRQRRLVKAESAGINLRAFEQKGAVFGEFNKYLGASVKASAMESALATEPDETMWEILLAQVDRVDTKTLGKLEQAAPNVYSNLVTSAKNANKSIEQYLAEKYTDLAGYLEYYRSRVEAELDIARTTSAFRQARSLPENPDILVRYQSGLDNELYKAMRALREAQTWRLASIDQVAAE